MTQRVYEQIRRIIETTPGLTQKGLAEKMHMNPAVVNRMLYGQRRIRAEEIPLIESYLGTRLDLSVIPANLEYPPSPLRAKRGLSDVAPQNIAKGSPDNLVPVYGYAGHGGHGYAMGGGLHKEFSLSKGDVVDWVTRHPAQFGIPGAFAIYVFSDKMEPRYFRGELVYIHPGRPPETCRDCFIEMENGDAALKRFLYQIEDKIRVAQFNPPEEKELLKSEIKAIYSVVGRG